MAKGHHQNDIALIKLSKLIDLSKPNTAKLEPCQTGRAFLYGTVMGLGLINERFKLYPHVLMEVELEVNDDCKKLRKEPFLLIKDYNSVTALSMGKKEPALGTPAARLCTLGKERSGVFLG